MRPFSRRRRVSGAPGDADGTIDATFRRLAYGGSTPAEVERDALRIEKRAMRAQWRWMATHPAEEHDGRKRALAAEMLGLADELRAAEVVLRRAPGQRPDCVRSEFEVEVPPTSLEEVVAERERLLALYDSIAGYPDRVRAGLLDAERRFAGIDLDAVPAAIRAARAIRRPWFHPEGLEDDPEEGRGAVEKPRA